MAKNIKDELAEVRKTLASTQKKFEEYKKQVAVDKATEKRTRGLDDTSKLQRDQIADAIALTTASNHDKRMIAESLADAMNLGSDERKPFEDACIRKLSLMEVA